MVSVSLLNPQFFSRYFSFRQFAIARFARYQQGKYSSQLRVEGKVVVEVWVTKDFAFFTSGSFGEGIQVSWTVDVVWSSGCQRNKGPLSHRQSSSVAEKINFSKRHRPDYRRFLRTSIGQVKSCPEFAVLDWLQRFGSVVRHCRCSLTLLYCPSKRR